jgi:hypothetical protein
MHHLMTTKHRRITISLPPEVDQAVTAMAVAQGIPHAKVVTNTLIEFVPTFLGLAKVMTQVKAGQQEAAKQTMRHVYGDQLAGLLSEQLDLTSSKKGRKK